MDDEYLLPTHIGHAHQALQGPVRVGGQVIGRGHCSVHVLSGQNPNSDVGHASTKGSCVCESLLKHIVYTIAHIIYYITFKLTLPEFA